MLYIISSDQSQVTLPVEVVQGSVVVIRGYGLACVSPSPRHTSSDTKCTHLAIKGTMGNLILHKGPIIPFDCKIGWYLYVLFELDSPGERSLLCISVTLSQLIATT